MATSPSPWKFLPIPSPYPSSQSLFFLIFQPQSISANRFRTLRLKICCSSQTIEIGTQGNSATKKKRKPRPSFLDQIQEKWSTKTTCSGEKLPWQEEEREKFEEVEENCLQSDGVIVTEIDSEKSSVVSEPASFISIEKVNLPPWAHGNKQRKSQFVSGVRNLDKSSDDGESISGSNVAPHINELGERLDFDDESGEKGVEYNDIPKGLSKKGQALVVEEDKGNEAVGMFQEFNSVKGLNDKTRRPWEKENERESVDRKRLRKSNADLAEKVIPEPELKRLRNVALRMVERIKVGAAGVTQALVDSIHEKWKEDEVVKLKFEGSPSMNMRRTHEILESRTGGLVVWRSGSSIVLYRGMAYKLDCVQSYKETQRSATTIESSSGALANDVNQSIGVKYFNGAAESPRTDSLKHINNLSSKEVKDLNELNLLLDELGPRFKDWSGREPLPVDADLLPAVLPGYKRPFRLLPHGVRQGLRDKEMTYFRRTARQMPPHFALGRNKELQGLAMAMVKLWKRSAIAKIAIKRGVQNTCNERMAEELKVKEES